MKDLLTNDYAIQINEKVTVNGKEGFKDAEYIYFTISAPNKEAIHMEQAALAYYLVETGYLHTAYPVRNIRGDWFTTIEESRYIVVRLNQLQGDVPSSNGELLADFHQKHTPYDYEPENISSYGQWKQLWINKLTLFEKQIVQEAKSKTNSNYYRLLMDILPYIIGISENAIQYMQETMEDGRYHEGDQGTIAFRRYHHNLLEPIIWPHDLVYDHPTRDIAEFIRATLLSGTGQSEAEVISFMNAYQSIRPLSIFSWRILYARLIFPIPIFDLLQKSFIIQDDDNHYLEMVDLLEKQTVYEQKLRSFFEIVGVDHETLNIPVLHWL